MPSRIPFIPSQNNYRLRIPLQNVPYLFDVHWNDNDAAWYMDIRESDETVIAVNMKLLLGAKLEGASTHPFFKLNKFTVIDTGNTKKDASYDDLGARIQVVLIQQGETFA